MPSKPLCFLSWIKYSLTERTWQGGTWRMSSLKSYAESLKISSQMLPVDLIQTRKNNTSHVLHAVWQGYTGGLKAVWQGLTGGQWLSDKVTLVDNGYPTRSYYWIKAAWYGHTVGLKAAWHSHTSGQKAVWQGLTGELNANLSHIMRLANSYLFQ